MNHYFLSHSAADGLEFSLKLADELNAGPPEIPVWLAERDIPAGASWSTQITEAIRSSKGLLFVMTEDSVSAQSGCADEWARALSYKLPILPLRLQVALEAPYPLGTFQFIDFTRDFEAGLAKLRRALAWMETPKGVLHGLKQRLSYKEHELRGASEQQKIRVQSEIKGLEEQIARQQRLIDDPQGETRRTEQRIATGLQRELEAGSTTGDRIRTRFVYPPPAAAPSWFQDRHAETALIGDFLQEEGLRLMTVVGRAGIGKTAMVCRLLKSLESGQLPDDGGPLSVDGIVYLSAKGSRRVRLPDLFHGLCQLLPEETAQVLSGVYQNLHLSTEAKVQQLLEAFPGGRTVVLLDNFEDVVDGATGDIRDRELDEALQGVLTLPQHGVKVIITTQVAPRKLLMVQAGRQRTRKVDNGLESPFAENILRAMDKDGKVGLRDAPDTLLAEVRERTRGYPRALEVLYASLAADAGTTLEEILSDARRLPGDVVQVLVGEAFSRLDLTAQRVMQALAVYTYPVPPTAVDYLLQPHLLGIDSAPVLNRLLNMQLVRREAGRYYLHHSDRTYALGRLPEGSPEDWVSSRQPPYTRYSLLHRGAEYFREVRRDESTWKSVEDLRPCIAELELLCASGDDEAALDLFGTMWPYLARWGYFRLAERLAQRLAHDAKDPFRSVASAWRAAALSALGETTEAIELLTAALKVRDTVSWRLELARCYELLSDHAAAAEEYRRVLDNLEEDDVDSQVATLLGLGSTAEARHAHEDAENAYLQALDVLVPSLKMEFANDQEIVSSPGALPPGVIVADPFVWHPLTRLTRTQDAEGNEVFYLYGIEIPDPEVASANGNHRAAEADAVDAREVDVVPVCVTATLADTWMSLAGLCGRTDRLWEASACCRLALDMYGYLEIDAGTARALELLRRVADQLSEDEAEKILTAQEDLRKRARDSGKRSLELAILDDLAACYLGRDRIDDAEALYLELSRHATELEDSFLQAQANFGLALIDLARGRQAEALVTLENLSKDGPQDLRFQTEVGFLRGRIESARHSREEAIRYFLAASRAYGALGSVRQQIEAERLLASIAIELRAYDDAVKRLEAAVRLVDAVAIRVPSVVLPLLCDLARAHLWAGDRDLALAVAEDASRRAGDADLPATAAEALLTVAGIRAELRDFRPAETAYQDAAAIYGRIADVRSQIDCRIGLARLYGLQDRREQELSEAHSAYALARDLADPQVLRLTRMELASAQSDAGLHAEALQHLEAVVDENQSDAVAIGTFGWVLYQAGHYDLSIQQSRRALAIDPTQTWTIRNLGHAYLAKGLPEDAEREYRRAFEDRRGGENFLETIAVVKRLLARQPETPRGLEMLELLEEEQRKLEGEIPADAGQARG